jgi:protein-S-isoprenylcysteine O-methyltransferase Ste14
MNHDRPNVWPWPPLIYLGTLLVWPAVDHLMPLDMPLSPEVRLGGFGLMLLGFVVDGWAMLTLQRAQTTIMPHRGALVLVSDGPYRFSRNPIYVGNTIVIAGLGVVVASWWLFLGAFVATALVFVLAVRREEMHLALRFGAAWDSYASRVGRWI